MSSQVWVEDPVFPIQTFTPTSQFPPGLLTTEERIVTSFPVNCSQMTEATSPERHRHIATTVAHYEANYLSHHFSSASSFNWLDSADLFCFCWDSVYCFCVLFYFVWGLCECVWFLAQGVHKLLIDFQVLGVHACTTTPNLYHTGGVGIKPTASA